MTAPHSHSTITFEYRPRNEAAGMRHNGLYSVNCVRIASRKHNSFSFQPKVDFILNSRTVRMISTARFSVLSY